MTHPFICKDNGKGKVFVVAKDGKIEKEFAAPGCQDCWRLPNGNTVICNWGGHGYVGKQPQLVEITPDKKVVWQVFDNTQFKTVSNVQLLDIVGDASKNEILR